MVKRLLIAVLFFLSIPSIASHIVGGEFNLLYLGPNKYQLNLILYFDALNGFEQLLDQEVNAHIYRYSDDSLILVKFLPRMYLENVPYYQENCEFDGVKTTRIVYGDTLTLSDEMFSDPEGYYVAWENCCRNYDVTNADTGNFPVPGTPPGVQSGQTYFLSFPAIVQDGKPFVNSSPSLFRALNSFGCVGVPYWADFGGVDNDGDTLLYSLILPYDVAPGYALNTTRPTPYPTITWVDGFGPFNIMGGNPKLSISADGMLTVTPQYQGLFIFAVQCREVRNGKVIGWAIREFQLYVTDWCEPNYPPEIKGKLANETSYNSEDVMIVDFAENLAPEYRCINVLITDRDAAIEEIVEIQAIPLNFDGDIDVVLPNTITALLQNGSGIEFDICFPECPLIDPELNEYYEIGILALDDACPLPRIDTLVIKVKINPPANERPYILTNGQNLDIYDNLVTESSGGMFTLPIVGNDPDGQNLSLTILPINDFDPSKAGMSFTTPSYTPGSVATQFIWNHDCDTELDFSEGVDVSVDKYATRKAYNFYIIVEDMDQCEFARADTLEMNLVIEFPGEASPNIFKEGGDEEKEYYEEYYEFNQIINYEVRAIDGAGDADPLNIFAIGEDFELAEYGASFNGVINGIGIAPGSKGVLNWPLNCQYFDLQSNNLFTVLFIVSDIDDCNLVNSDTLKVDFTVSERINSAPELSFINIPGAPPIVDNELTVDYLSNVDFQVIAIDTPDDSVSINIGPIIGINDVGAYQYSSVDGKGSATASFSMDLGCGYLNGVENGKYKIQFIAQDWACENVLSDTLELKLTVIHHLEGQQAFVAPNVFTPNGDGINDYFAMHMLDLNKRHLVNILPPDDCAGSFEEITILNRWGSSVFRSDNRDFQWYGEDSPAGVYYYVIRYSHKEYNGTVSLLF